MLLANFVDFQKTIISYFEDSDHKNDSQLGQELREIWMDEDCTRCRQEKVYNPFIVNYMNVGSLKRVDHPFLVYNYNSW